MDSAGLRNRNRGDDNPVQGNFDAQTPCANAESLNADSWIPRYTIDLSLQPIKRYENVAKAFEQQAAGLPVLFDQVVRDWLPKLPVPMVRQVARLTLRRVSNEEENEELQGIAQVTGVEMWLLVALNVLLDAFMGCTSGGVRVDHNGRKSRMLHLRTLDWGMDPLRKIVVQLDFVERPGGKVIASSVGYFGYVGILTGVRKGLSMSLNFRPTHNQNSRLENFRFHFHTIMVLLGFRPSISSLIRQCLLSSCTASGASSLMETTLESIERSFPRRLSTAAYVIFSDGNRTTVMEKDHRSAVVRSADDFITATNHDVAAEYSPCSGIIAEQDLKTLDTSGMGEIVEESVLRKNTVKQLWQDSLGGVSNPRRVLNAKRIAAWMGTYPITNEDTHFAMIMDPKAGTVVWGQHYVNPPEFEFLD